MPTFAGAPGSAGLGGTGSPVAHQTGTPIRRGLLVNGDPTIRIVDRTGHSPLDSSLWVTDQLTPGGALQAATGTTNTPPRIPRRFRWSVGTFFAGLSQYGTRQWWDDIHMPPPAIPRHVHTVGSSFLQPTSSQLRIPAVNLPPGL